MTTTQPLARTRAARPAAETDAAQRRRNRILVGSLLAVAAITAFLISIGETGVAGTTRANPNPVGNYQYGGVIRVHPPYLGVTNWPLVFQFLTVALNLACWAPFVWIWWRRGRIHPGLVLMFALWFACSALDPLANWGYAAVYDPRILHFPVDWPYVSMAPLVEPILAVGGWQWWYMAPGLLGYGIWRVASRRKSETSFINRRPAVSLFLIGFATGAVIDITCEIFFIKSMIYMYSQLKGPMLWGGRSWQFPIIWGPLMQVFLYGLTATFLWRDDQGRTVCGRYAARRATLRRRPFLSEVVLASAVFTVAYLAGIGPMAVLKHSASTEACPWPFPEAKTYDPTGLWAEKGHPGPFMKGVWSDGPL